MGSQRAGHNWRDTTEAHKEASKAEGLVKIELRARIRYAGRGDPCWPEWVLYRILSGPQASRVGSQGLTWPRKVNWKIGLGPQGLGGLEGLQPKGTGRAGEVKAGGRGPGPESDQSWEGKLKRTVSAEEPMSLSLPFIPSYSQDRGQTLRPYSTLPRRASPGLRSGPTAAQELCGPHLPSCLLLCRKVWTWARSCSPSATCPQQAGSPSPWSNAGTSRQWTSQATQVPLLPRGLPCGLPIVPTSGCGEMLRKKGEELPVFFDWSTDLQANGLALNTSYGISLLCNVLVSWSEQKKKKKKQLTQVALRINKLIHVNA